MSLTLPLTVYYEDTDSGGVVYHANYLRYMERARSEWLLSIGYDVASMQRYDAMFVVHRVNMEILRPARLYDRLQVVSRIDKVNRVSLSFHQEICEASKESCILCRAEIKIACVNGEFKPCRIPEVILREIAL